MAIISIMLTSLLPTILLVTIVDALANSGGGFGKTSPRKATKKRSDVSALKKYNPDDSPAIRKLWGHLIDVEECEGLESVEVGFDISTNLRGMYAKEEIRAGEYICAIPYVTTLLVNESFFAGAKRSKDIRFSSSKIEHGKRFLEDFRDNEKYKHYLDCLPGLSGDDPNFVPTPDFWNDDEIQELQMPVLVEDMIERKLQAEEAAADMKETSTAELQHAMWTVRTRAFTTLKKAIDLDSKEGLLQRTVLIPALDLLNHDSRNPNAELKAVETKDYNESFFALVAKRHISDGQELCIGYGTGEDTSLEIYSKYGFWPSDNEKVDSKSVGKWETNWTTTIEQDHEELRSITSSEMSDPRRSYLEFRIRMKELQKITGMRS